VVQRLKRQFIVVLLASVWLFAAAWVTVAILAEAGDEGWGEVAPWAWVMAGLLYLVALPALMYGWHKWGSAREPRATS
jgi:hypothetical protein